MQKCIYKRESNFNLKGIFGGMPTISQTTKSQTTKSRKRKSQTTKSQKKTTKSQPDDKIPDDKIPDDKIVNYVKHLFFCIFKMVMEYLYNWRGNLDFFSKKCSQKRPIIINRCGEKT